MHIRLVNRFFQFDYKVLLRRRDVTEVILVLVYPLLYMWVSVGNAIFCLLVLGTLLSLHFSSGHIQKCAVGKVETRNAMLELNDEFRIVKWFTTS